VIEGRPGIDIKVFADLPHRRGITSLFDKSSDKVKDLSLSGRQFHRLPPESELAGFQSIGKGKDAGLVDGLCRWS
jgi:hypothetical protein